MADAPIGILDSGFGGLTGASSVIDTLVLRCARNVLLAGVISYVTGERA